MSSAIDGLKCSEVLLQRERDNVSLFELVVISISLAMDAFTVSMMYVFRRQKEILRNKASLLFILAFFRH